MQNMKYEAFRTLKTMARTSQVWTMLSALVLALGAGLIASPAAAAGPTILPFTKTSSAVITGLCQFDINANQIFTGTEIDFFDNSGN